MFYQFNQGTWLVNQFVVKCFVSYSAPASSFWFLLWNRWHIRCVPLGSGCIWSTGIYDCIPLQPSQAYRCCYEVIFDNIRRAHSLREYGNCMTILICSFLRQLLSHWSKLDKQTVVCILICLFYWSKFWIWNYLVTKFRGDFAWWKRGGRIVGVVVRRCREWLIFVICICVRLLHEKGSP